MREKIKLESTADNRRDYREMMFSAKEAMRSHISGVILFDETIRQKGRDGKPLVELIASAGSIPSTRSTTLPSSAGTSRRSAAPAASRSWRGTSATPPPCAKRSAAATP